MSLVTDCLKRTAQGTSALLPSWTPPKTPRAPQTSPLTSPGTSTAGTGQNTCCPGSQRRGLRSGTHAGGCGGRGDGRHCPQPPRTPIPGQGTHRRQLLKRSLQALFCRSCRHRLAWGWPTSGRKSGDCRGEQWMHTHTPRCIAPASHPRSRLGDGCHRDARRVGTRLCGQQGTPHRCHCSHPILIPSCSVCLGWKSPPATHLLLEEPADDLFPHLLPLLVRGELVVRLGCPGRGRCCRQRYRARLCPVPPTEPPASPNEVRRGVRDLSAPMLRAAACTGGGVPPLLPPAGRGAGCQTQACCSPGSFTYSKGGRKRPARALRAGTSRDRFTGTCFPLAAPRAVRSLHTGEAPAAPPYVPGPPWKTNPAVQGTHPLLTQTVQ